MSKNHETNLVISLSIFSVFLVVARVYISQSIGLAFMVWNLFLAWLPYLFSFLIIKYRERWKQLVFSIFWLLFLPNAPYMITDLLHLHLRSVVSIPLWFDVLLLFTFSFLGLLLFFFSVKKVHRHLEYSMQKIKAWIIIYAVFFLTGFGIYLGRFLRWNSWDLFTRPYALFADMSQLVLLPFHHPNTWAFTIGISGFLIIVYKAVYHTKLQ